MTVFSLLRYKMRPLGHPHQQRAPLDTPPSHRDPMVLRTLLPPPPPTPGAREEIAWGCRGVAPGAFPTANTRGQDRRCT